MTTPSAPGPTAGSALVIGGGLAGIAAAVRLADAGWQVTLLEARRTLGGRVFSFANPAGAGNRDGNGNGAALDNGQHVIVGACRNLIGFLRHIGAWQHWHLQPQLDAPIYDRSGRRGRLYGVNLPAPAHLLPSFVAYPHLTALDKLRAGRGLIAAMRTRRSDPALEQITFEHWLRSNGQSARAIRNLWQVLIEGTLNDQVGAVSAAMGLMMVQDGLLQSNNAANIGYPTAPLQDAVGTPARRFLESRGVRLLTGCPARRINLDAAGAVCGVSAGNGLTLHADAYISAAPFWTLPELLPPALALSAPFAGIARLESAPIVNIHLRYDRPLMSDNFCYFVDSPLQWVFNRSAIHGHAADGGNSGNSGQNLTVSISAAWDYIDGDRADLAARTDAEIRCVFPAAASAILGAASVVKQRKATFRCRPGAAALRPGPVTPVPNLFLAGEWTATGWPSTMESAVISGYNAAAAVLAADLQLHPHPHPQTHHYPQPTYGSATRV